MDVLPATAADLVAVHAAYADGRRTQREQGAVVWPEFSDAAILSEIAAGRLLRVIDGDTLVGVFSIAYEDPAIWGEHERGAHIYLHRIARAAGYRGRGLIDMVLAWARRRCSALGRSGLRMDTWATNDALIAYYQRLGFQLIGRQRIASDPRLPSLMVSQRPEWRPIAWEERRPTGCCETISHTTTESRSRCSSRRAASNRRERPTA